MKDLFKTFSGCLILAIMGVGILGILMAFIKVIIMMWRAVF